MGGRAEALDGLRGLAALAFAASGLFALGGAASAWRLGLGADLLLLLAGFTAARAHRPALEAGRGAARFILSRVMRVMPLNAAILAALLLFATLAALVETGRGPDFGAAEARAFFASLALVQILAPGVEGWNPAAWVLAAELQGSALLALLCLTGVTARAPGRAAVLALVLLAVGARMAGGLAPSADLLARAFAAFFAGALLHALLASAGATEALRRAKRRAGTALECWAAAALLGFAALAPEAAAPLAPLAAFGPVFVFLKRGGALSAALEGRAAQALGRRGAALATAHPLLFPAAGLIGPLGALALALALADLLWRKVEAPTRRAMWAWLDRRLPAPEAEAARR